MTQTPSSGEVTFNRDLEASYDGGGANTGEVLHPVTGQISRVGRRLGGHFREGDAGPLVPEEHTYDDEGS